MTFKLDMPIHFYDNKFNFTRQMAAILENGRYFESQSCLDIFLLIKTTHEECVR